MSRVKVGWALDTVLTETFRIGVRLGVRTLASRGCPSGSATPGDGLDSIRLETRVASIHMCSSIHLKRCRSVHAVPLRNLFECGWDSRGIPIGKRCDDR